MDLYSKEKIKLKELHSSWFLIFIQKPGKDLAPSFLAETNLHGLLPKDWTPCDQNPSHAVRTSLETWGGISFSELERLTWQAWHDHLKIPCVLLSQNMQKLSSYWPGRPVSLTSFHSPGRHCAGLREKGFAKRFTQMWTRRNTIMIGMAICAPGCSDIRNFMEEPTTFWLELRPAPLEEIHA